MKGLCFERIEGDFSVCRVRDFSCVDLDAKFCFLGKTDEEYSLVCLSPDVPDNAVAREDGFRAFRIAGVLDLSLVGILSRVADVLAAAGIGIFAVSTYNTDYVLTKAENYERALALLEKAE